MLYFTNSPEIRTFETTSMDGMSLLEATRSHIHKCLQRDPFFIRLTIYFSIRSKDLDMFQNGTKVAFAGNAYYTLPSSIVDEEDIASDTLLCFLGKNHSAYIESLQIMGWDIVEKTQIMTLSGDMIEMQEDGGGMVIVSSGENNADDPDADDNDNEKAMAEGASMMMIMIATIVPLSLVIVCTIGWFLYKIFCSVSWKAPKTADENDPMWSVNHPLSKHHRRQSARSLHATTAAAAAAAADGNNSEFDQASTQVVVHSKQSPV